MRRARWLGLAVVMLAFAGGAGPATEPASRDSSGSAAQVGAGKVVGLDYFYNHQFKDGKQVGPVWENTGPDGFSEFGEIWKKHGATLAHVDGPPTRQELDRLAVYIIVSPCNEETALDHHPNYIDPAAIETIVSWVKDGGVLVLFANAKGKSDLEHLNELATHFGVTFQDTSTSTIPDPHDTVLDRRGEKIAAYPERLELFGVPMTYGLGFPKHLLFRRVKTISIPELAVLTVCEPAKVLLTERHVWRFKKPIYPHVKPGQAFGTTIIGGQVRDDVIMATCAFESGMVFAIGAPWFINSEIFTQTAGATSGDRVAASNCAEWLLGENSKLRMDR